jgi:hypothetical protein
MSLEKIYEATKTELDDIEQRAPRFWIDLSASEAAFILRIVSEQFYAVHKLLKESGGLDEKKLLSQEQMQNIMGLFQELVDNFFPMAHTSDPLGNLRIINYTQLREILLIQKQSIHQLVKYDECMEQVLNP